jgi:Ca2+-binding RTX toxin-like protein
MKRAGVFLTLMSVMVFVFAGIAVATIINGNNGNNTLVGTPRADVIRGYSGADSISGGGGEDELMGGAGNDYIAGGPGYDRCKGGPGADTLRGCEQGVP